jgi:hypothetical protein
VPEHEVAGVRRMLAQLQARPTPGAGWPESPSHLDRLAAPVGAVQLEQVECVQEDVAPALL